MMMMDDALDANFEPTSKDIVLARGRTVYNFCGNRRFRSILERHLPQYAAAKSKQEKSVVVTSILELIREDRPEGGFVRKGPDGKWYKAADHVCREKIGQGFRDLLHTRYRSSTKSKVHIRRERRQKKRSSSAASDGEDNKTDNVAANSTEYIEPIPLEETFSDDVDDSLIYDCPFSFGSREEGKIQHDFTNDFAEVVASQKQEATKSFQDEEDEQQQPLPSVTPSSKSDRETVGRERTAGHSRSTCEDVQGPSLACPPSEYQTNNNHYSPPPPPCPPSENFSSPHTPPRRGPSYYPYYQHYHHYYGPQGYSSWWDNYYSHWTSPGGSQPPSPYSPAPPPRWWGDEGGDAYMAWGQHATIDDRKARRRDC